MRQYRKNIGREAYSRCQWQWQRQQQSTRVGYLHENDAGTSCLSDEIINFVTMYGNKLRVIEIPNVFFSLRYITIRLTNCCAKYCARMHSIVRSTPSRSIVLGKRKFSLLLDCERKFSNVNLRYWECNRKDRRLMKLFYLLNVVKHIWIFCVI